MLCLAPGCGDNATRPSGAGPDADPIGECGDGLVSQAEACDDANTDDGDGCSAACEVEEGFACSGEPSACAAVCGDALIAGDEECDDDNAADGDGCAATCAVENGYTCNGTPSVCAPTCGDGLILGGEECDDDNADALDGCSDTCTVEVGVTCTGEPSVCTAECGDGVIATIEECDTGALGIDDGCTDACVVDLGWSCMGEPSVCVTGCGDGIPAGPEACDDGNNDDGDGCSAACEEEPGHTCTGAPSTCATTCGDGIIAGAEVCDDGNVTPGDGCSDVCAVEPGHACTGEPSACATVCGDGVIAGAEGCDDGSFEQGDGCDSRCQAEFGFTCAGTPSSCTQGETVVQVALGGEGGCIRTLTGRVACFGLNSESEVGNGTDAVQTFLPADTQIADATVVVAGNEHHCALRAGGTVWCWGDNIGLQQGVAGTANDQPVPQQVAGLTGIALLEAGDDFNCAVDSGGDVLCWGDNDNRQLGRGGTTTTDSEVPTVITLPSGNKAAAIALGGDHACALLSDATVACWGDDDQGQLGDGAAGTDNGDPAVVPGLADVVQISAGFDNTCARTTAGAVLCWGDNLDGQIGDGTTTDRPSPTPVPLVAGAVDISAGTDFVCASLVNGEVWCWGEATDWETGVGTNVDQLTPGMVRGLAGLNVTDVETGARGACVLTSTNERHCWGFSEQGELGIFARNQLVLSDPIPFAGGAPTSFQISKPEFRGQVCAGFGGGSVECMGTGDTVSTSTVTGAIGVFPGFTEHLSTPTVIPALAGTIEGGLGDGFACGRTPIAVACVGDNAQRQLGQGTSTTDSAVPVLVMGLGAVDEIEVGGQFACARTGGTVQCWGDSDGRQCGADITTDQGSPVTLPGAADAIDIELGEDHGCLIRAGGVVACWGENGLGQLGIGMAGADSATPLAVLGLPVGIPVTQLALGQDHSCALAGSEVWCWGENGRGQLGQGTTTDSATPVLVVDDATAISAGYSYVCAVRTGGTVTCWGYGLDGQLGNGGSDVTGIEDYLSPVDWPGVSGVLAIETGNSVTCLDVGLGWQCTGFRANGHLGNGTTLHPTIPTRVQTL